MNSNISIYQETHPLHPLNNASSPSEPSSAWHPSAFGNDVAGKAPTYEPSAVSSEFSALTFDGWVERISFSPDSTRFAVLAEGRVIGFKINEDKSGIFEEFRISSSSKATCFCWDLSPEPLMLVAFTESPISAFDITANQLRAIDNKVYPKVTAMACVAQYGKNILVIATENLLRLFHLEKHESQDLGDSKWHLDLHAQFTIYKKDRDVGTVKQLEIRDGNLAILTANKKFVSAFGVLTRDHPNVIIQPWPVQNFLGYGSIALCPGANSFITGRKDGKIYAADTQSLAETYNHSVDVFNEEGDIDVHAVSFYPSASKYSIFSVAGQADTIKFVAKDDIKNTFEVLEEYTMPVLWRSKVAYNVFEGTLVEHSQSSINNTFNPFKPIVYTTTHNTSVIHTVFSPDGQYFAYATNIGMVGIKKFKLLDRESSMIIKDEKSADDEYWEKLSLIASNKMPGTWVE